MGSAGWTQGNRVDSTVAHELAILTKVEKAAAVTAFEKRIAAVIGMVGTKRLRRHLVENLSFADAAADRGHSGREAATFSAKYFRDSLEMLADAFGATGRAKRA
jgi:exosome complex RNA-binding protein Csl4